VVAAIAKQHPLPLRFIGVGEGVDDLQPFVAGEFVDALLPAAQ
jgi:fused signal recognition particle receptor